MSHLHWMAIATLTALSAAATAQDTVRTDDPTNPAALASRFRYESVFGNYQQMTEENETPDKAWRKANQEMGQLGGHAGHMKGVSGPSSVSSGSEASHAEPKAGDSAARHGHHRMDQENKGK